MNSLPFFNTRWIHANAHGHKCSHENKKATTYFIIKNISDLPNIFFDKMDLRLLYFHVKKLCNSGRIVVMEHAVNVPSSLLHSPQALTRDCELFPTWEGWTGVHKQKRWQEVEDQCERIEQGRIPAQTPCRTAGKIYISLWGIFRSSCLAQIPFSTWITRKTAQLSLQMWMGNQLATCLPPFWWSEWVKCRIYIHLHQGSDHFPSRCREITWEAIIAHHSINADTHLSRQIPRYETSEAHYRNL